MLRVIPLVFVLLTFTHLAGADTAKKTSFASVVEANFEKWDLNHDGKISREETDRLVADRAITGDEAAAVAAIHLYLRSKKHNEPLSRELLTQKPGKEGDSERRDKDERRPHFESNYQGFRRHIAKAPRELFVGDAPKLEGMHQGHLGDCYLISAIGAAVARSPAHVKSLFHPLPGGACELTFPDGRRVHVSKMTDAEIALGSTAGAQGLWLNVLEKGFGQLKLARSKKPHLSGVSMDIIAHGGDPDVTIELLSGHRGKQVVIRTGNGKEPPPENRIPHLIAELRQVFRLSNALHPLLCCATSRAKHPPGVVGDHAYGILGYDASRDSVLVWNPWGNRHKVKDEPGLQNGYETEGGKFYVPLNEFVRIFEEVYYESAMPPRRRR